VPLAVGGRQVGWLLASPQPGRRLREDELALLEQLGRHAGVAVNAVHLAEQVADHHRTLLTAREEERRRLGRDLHDGLGPTIAGLSMQLGALRPLVHGDPDGVVARLATLEQAAAGALADLRRVAHELRPPVLDQVGLARAVAQAAESLDLTPVEADFDHGDLPAAVELAAYRIMTEALSNVARHSGVRTVRLRARRTGSSLVVTVADDGRGPDESGSGATSGLGSRTMRERAAELGGTLSIRTGGRGGTVVTAVLPLETQVDAAASREQR
jgi:signal transduction histidine kinase